MGPEVRQRRAALVPWHWYLGDGGGHESPWGQEEHKANFRRGMEAETSGPLCWQRPSLEAMA